MRKATASGSCRDGPTKIVLMRCAFNVATTCALIAGVAVGAYPESLMSVRALDRGVGGAHGPHCPIT
jgi:hypothetical protein